MKWILKRIFRKTWKIDFKFGKNDLGGRNGAVFPEKRKEKKGVILRNIIPLIV